jgi:hypothetical protein
MIVTKQININSADGIKKNSTKNSDVFFNFKNILSNDNENDYVDFSVESVQIPVSFYNITSDNNLLDWDGNLLTITPGNYNTTSLNTEIISQLASVAITTVSITLSTVTGKYTFIDSTSDFTLYYATSTIFKVLGFITDQNHTSTSLTLTSTYPVNLLGPLKMKITSGDINISNIDSASSGGSMNTLIEIPVSAANFGLILYNNVSNIHSILNQKILNGFDIKIQSDTGALMDFNNIDWTMSFLLKIHKKNIENKNIENKNLDKKNIENKNIDKKDIEPIKTESKPKEKSIDELNDDEILMK